MGALNGFQNARYSILPRHLTIVNASTTPIKKNKSVARRERLNNKRRIMNRARKAGLSIRMKKALTALSAFSASNSQVGQDLNYIENLISKLYSEVDKAVGKGVIHSNTGSRRKSRIALEKKKVLLEKGLYLQNKDKNQT